MNKWEKFLYEVIENTEVIPSFGQWVYNINHDIRVDKILLLIGPERTGKSLICSLLANCVGIENCLFSFPKLTSDYHRSSIKDKKLCIADPFDFNLSNMASCYLKSVVSGDKLYFRKKFEDTPTVFTPNCAFIFTTNNDILPFNNFTWIRRILPIKTQRLEYSSLKMLDEMLDISADQLKEWANGYKDYKEAD